MFANDTSLLSVIHDIDTTANYFNHKLEEICEWSFQQKISFNQDPSKQAQELIFSKKKTVSIHPVVYFNNTLVNSMATHKRLGIVLGSKLCYENHLQPVFSRVDKTIGL